MIEIRNDTTIMNCQTILKKCSTLIVLTLVAFLLHGDSDRRVHAAENRGFASIVPPGELVDAEGTLQFYGQAEIENFLGQEYEALGSEPWVTTDAQMAFKRVSALVERMPKASSLDEQGCVRPFSFRHREEAYQTPPDLFSDPERGFQQTPLDLAERAPEILVVEAQASEPGVLDGEMGTLVRFEIIEWIKSSPTYEKLDEPRYFLTSDIWLTLAGRSYCQRRDNVREPKAGDRFLLFGTRSELLSHQFWTGNIFPLDGQLILPQPYPLMWQGLPISLEALKESIQ